MELNAISQLVANPIFMANSMAFLFKTGKTPGRPRHTGQVLEFGRDPNLTGQPQNILDSVSNCAWISNPIIAS